MTKLNHAFLNIALCFNFFDYVAKYFPVPDPVGNLTSPPTFPTNMTSISWSPPQLGSADYYRVTYTDSSGEIFHNETTNQTSYELDVVYGEKYNVEVRSVFAGYQSDPESRETVICK